MGLNGSKTKKITVPKDYKLIKMCSFNVNLRNSVNAENKIKEILNYFKDSSCDIICVQGMYDYVSAYNMVKAIKTHADVNKETLYFTPNIEILDVKQDYLKPLLISVESRSKSNKSNKSNRNKKDNYKNMIISKYPIVSSSFTKLDEETDIDDIVGVQTVVCANISIDNRIISVYNTELCKDIKIANIINDSVRELELQEIFQVINKNRAEYTDVHFLIGTLNIKEEVDQEISDEYISLTETYNCVDVYRYKHSNAKGSTNQFNERVDYIFLLLSPKNLKNEKEKIDSFIHKLHKMYFLDVNVKQDYKHISKTSFPLEAVFMIKVEKTL